MENYLGSQQAIEDEINERYDEMARINKERENEYYKEILLEQQEEYYKEQKGEYYKYLESLKDE